MAGSEAAYGCVYQTEDPDGVVGVRLSKELMAVAGEALKVSVSRHRASQRGHSVAPLVMLQACSTSVVL